MSKITKTPRNSSDKAKENYRVLNWGAYNKALINRGNITIYFSDEAIKGWHDDGPVQRGGHYVYSDLYIETLLLHKVVFKLAYRQTQGFAESLLTLMDIDLPVPSYSQLQRRSGSLEVEGFAVPKTGRIDMVIDSTGLKVYGEGGWKVRKHGWSKRRTWRKLHLGCDQSPSFLFM